LVWLIPVLYWFGDRDRHTVTDFSLQFSSFIAMGWLSFLFIILVILDLVYGIALWAESTWMTSLLDANLAGIVTFGATLCVILGIGRAAGGPLTHEVKVKIPHLPKSLNGLRIVQISDLHVGPTIRESYVRRMVEAANSLSPDLVCLTGDLVDGPVSALAPHVEPLRLLKSKLGSFLCLGNHDYYSGAEAWTRHFESLGIRVLRNQFQIVNVGVDSMLVAGVTDPAAKMFDQAQEPNPSKALTTSYDERPHDTSRAKFRLMLAHNPKLAPACAACGFDLQLSGHTHGGQFFPWTLVTRLVHAPHYWGLSREQNMTVYVSAGTGTWGPPIRLGTTPELTLLILSNT
jgi:uncharacterized protein